MVKYILSYKILQQYSLKKIINLQKGGMEKLTLNLNNFRGNF